MTFIKFFICLGMFALLAACSSAGSAAKGAADYFREGEQAYTEKNYEEAIALWKKVKESYVSQELTTRAELNIADANYNIGNYIEAAAEYENFRKLHPKHEKSSYALFRLGMCNFKQITGFDTDQTPVTNSLTLFRSYLETYPASDLVKEVQSRIDELMAMQLRHEIYVGRFYLRTEKYTAAIRRLEGALAKFPSSPLNDETLLYLGQAYMLSGERGKSREVFNRLSTEYASSQFLDDAKKFMEKNY